MGNEEETTGTFETIISLESKPILPLSIQENYFNIDKLIKELVSELEEQKESVLDKVASDNGCMEIINNLHLIENLTDYGKDMLIDYVKSLHKQLRDERQKNERNKRIVIDKLNKLKDGLENDFPITLGEQQPLWEDNYKDYVKASKIREKLKQHIEERDSYDKDEERDWGTFNRYDWEGYFVRELQDILGEEKYI